MARVRRRGTLLVRTTIAAVAIAAAATGIDVLWTTVSDPTAAMGRRGFDVVDQGPNVPTVTDRGSHTHAHPRRRLPVQGAGRKVPSAADLRPPPPPIPARAGEVRSVARPRAAAAPPAQRIQAPRSVAYRGRNHVWIPSLGINRSIRPFPCSRDRPPDAGVYRWGCAGSHNVYLMSHAWSTFKPLHDAYASGRLRSGIRVWYADGASRVRRYRVIWWRVTAPTTAASWAWAALRVPSMTLQTCVGTRSELRLMVRLVADD